MAAADDPHNLARFIEAQTRDYDAALAEIRAGQKRSHWMWYIFPQFAGLGRSSTAEFYAIKSVAEARAYVQHRQLRLRLNECCEALLAVEGRTAGQIFGFPDELKLRSSLTLFAHVSPPASIFQLLLDKYFAGERDERTILLINRPRDIA